MPKGAREETTESTNFFSAAEERTDRWRQLTALGGSWESAAATAQPDDAFHAAAARSLAELGPLESYFAYPGPRLMAAVAKAVEERSATVFARLVQRISNNLLTGTYRYE